MEPGDERGLGGWLQPALAIGAAATASLVLLPLPAAGFAAALAGLAVVVAKIDLDRYIIPDTANALLLAAGLCLVALEAASGERLQALSDALLRAAAAGGALLLLRALYFRYAGHHGLGLGDVKLAGAAGPWLGWGTLPLALELAALGALLAAVIAARRSGVRLERQLALPFGAFLAPATWLAFMAERLDWLP